MSGVLAADRLLGNVEIKGDFKPTSVKLVNKFIEDQTVGGANAADITLNVALMGTLFEVEPQAVDFTGNIIVSDARIGTEMFVHNRDGADVNIKAPTTAAVAVSGTRTAHIVFVDDGNGAPLAVKLAESS